MNGTGIRVATQYSNCNCNCNFNSQRILETNFINIFDPTFVQTIKSNPQGEDSKMIL